MKRRDFVLAAAGTALFLAFAIGSFVAVRDASELGHVRTVLAKAVDPTQNPCGSVTDASRTPSAFSEIPAGFARLAVERAAIICNDVGPATYYFRFTDHHVLETALRRYPSVLSQSLCALDHEVFTGDAMDFSLPPPGPFRSTCRLLGGRVLASAPARAKRSSPVSRRAAYPCRLAVTAPRLGRVNLRPALLARGVVRCYRRVRASVNVMIEGQFGPPGGGDEAGLAEFRPGRTYSLIDAFGHPRGWV